MYTLDNTTKAYANSSASLAQYTAPHPRDATYHHYIFCLFNQPASYALPEEALNGSHYSQTTNVRLNFTLDPVLAAVSQPVAATYFIASDGN